MPLFRYQFTNAITDWIQSPQAGARSMPFSLDTIPISPVSECSVRDLYSLIGRCAMEIITYYCLLFFPRNVIKPRYAKLFHQSEVPNWRFKKCSLSFRKHTWNATISSLYHSLKTASWLYCVPLFGAGDFGPVNRHHLQVRDLHTDWQMNIAFVVTRRQLGGWLLSGCKSLLSTILPENLLFP